jgi:hypothetical protein
MKLKERYSLPTPKKMRKLGDSLLAVSTTIATYAIADDWSKWAQISALLLGVLGKFLSNFFTEDDAI